MRHFSYALLIFTFGCVTSPSVPFENRLIARIPPGLRPRWFRFSDDGSAVAYIGQDAQGKDRVVVNGEMGKPYVYEYKDREIKFCCKNCVKDFNKDTAKYIKKLEEAEAKAKK